jgi:hypothetical protein
MNTYSLPVKVRSYLTAIVMVMVTLIFAVHYTASVFAITVPSTDLVSWDFEDQDAVADGGISANNSSAISAVGAGTVGFNAGNGSDYAVGASSWVYSETVEKYWETTLSTKGYESITLSFDTRSSATGPLSFDVQYKVADGDWQSVYPVVFDAENWHTFSDISLPVDASDNESVSIRWLSADLEAGTLGTNRLDNVVVKGVAKTIGEPAPDTTAPSLSFVDPTPADGEWINENDSVISISSNEDLSAAYLDMLLENSGFEDGTTGYVYEGNVYWENDFSVYVEGTRSLRNSGYNMDNISSYVERTVTLVEDGEVSFWWMADTEEGKDVFTFSIDGSEQAAISGQVAGSEVTFPLSVGEHTLRWTYTKDASGSVGADTVWLDDLNVRQGPTGEGFAMDAGDSAAEALYQFQDLIDGVYLYRVTMYDLANNKTVSNDRSFKVDTALPTGYVWVSPYADNRETSGDKVYLSTSLQDYGSYIDTVCMWLGDEEDNLLQPEASYCKTLDQRDSNSWPYAPSYVFGGWDSNSVADGEYNLYAIVTDNAGNIAKIGLNNGLVVNNYSEGSEGNPSEISTCEDLQAINNNLNWHYTIVNDIDCSATKSWNGGKGFVRIGDESKTFTGSVEGNNHIIWKLYQSQPGTNSGMFYYMSGHVSGINLQDAEIVCHSTYCGGMMYLNGGTFEKSSITGTLSCSGKCGGFAAQNSGTISECWGDMTIGTGGYQGGIAGQNSNGFIKNSYFDGKITANNGGGIVGLNEGGWGGGVVENSYSNAEVIGGQNGGLIGWMYQYSSQTGSYWNTETSGKDIMCGISGGTCADDNGLTDAEMKDANNFVGWDFENVWAIDPDKNGGYPYLQWQTFATFVEPPVDTVDPVVTLNGSADMSVTVGGTYTELGATALDDVDGVIDVEVSGSVDTSTIGVYTLTYTATDTAGNSGVASRTVRVVAATQQPPVVQSGGGGAVFTYLAPTPSGKRGDLNQNGIVDKYDLALLMAQWNRRGYSMFDLNADGVVDKYDFALLMSVWGN